MRPQRHPRLTEGTVVQVDLGVTAPMDAVVVGFFGRVIVVGAEQEALDRFKDKLAARAEAYLLVEREDGLWALKGSITLMSGTTVGLEITDGFSLGQRREWSRAPLEVAATVSPAGDEPGGPVETVTIDVSAGGVRLQRHDGMPAWSRCRLELSGGGLGAPITAEAELVRTGEASIGLRFTRLEDADRAALVGLSLSELAGQLAGT